MAGEQETIGIRLGDQYVPTSAYVNAALCALEERLGKRLDELAGRVGALETPGPRQRWDAYDLTYTATPSGETKRYKAVPEEKWVLIEQVLEKAVDWHIAYTQKPALVYQDRSLVLLGDLKLAVDAYRKQDDQ